MNFKAGWYGYNHYVRLIDIAVHLTINENDVEKIVTGSISEQPVSVLFE